MGRYEGYKEEQDGDRRLQAAIFLVCAPWARSNGCKSRTRPDSGKCIAEQQVHREVESEESCKQISGPTDRNHI